MSTQPFNASSAEDPTATLEILTGPGRGTACWLIGTTLDLSLDDANRLTVTAPGSGPDAVARLHRSADSYEIETLGEGDLWINGERVLNRQLAQKDMIEFGNRGPLTRYRLYHQGGRLKRSLGDMLDDAVDYARSSRRPRVSRLIVALLGLSRDFALETTMLFRVGVLIALAVLAFFTYQQYRADQQLQQQASSSARQLDVFARSLTRASEEALRPADLNRLRQELRLSLSDAEERLELLELRSAASPRIIAAATSATVFLQGSYGYREVDSGRLLRYRTDDDGNPLFSLRGQPMLTPEGDGEVARRVFTGTAFLVSADGLMLTNRHVALPWEDDGGEVALQESAVEPVILRFIGYLPGIEAAFPVELLRASDETDLALLKGEQPDGALPYLELGEAAPEPGAEVIVLGYPTGLRAMLAQSGDRFLAELQEDESLDFWAVAERLSTAGFIRPLASRGIVGQRSAATVVYDAETTYGGSGGPVLDVEGRVIAVNTAIIPEYGGSNFGVPVGFARQLLAQPDEDSG